ncbi:MAG TPA: queuosine salvage family protein [Acidimicrobiales bacterium]|nr:queuosine salvage family protein [Acidimicrobiales bacterium]
MTATDAGPADVFDRVRAACAAVARQADWVRIDGAAVGALAATVEPEEPPLLPEEHTGGDEEAVAASVLAWNAVNFGSGWFPDLRKRPGLSGARTLAACLADHTERAGPPTAAWLAGAAPETCAAVFDQPHPGRVDDLLALFARAWRDLGGLLIDRFAGSAAALVRSAEGSAATLVGTLDEMPLMHDVARHGDLEVPLYKRAQITASHLARATGGAGIGQFVDIDRLTAFADNLVPHTLRMAGVLVYDDRLADRIGAGEPLAAGSPEEVEIRACGVHAVELLAACTGLTPAALDHQLWQRGQDPAVKAVPRHRTRCPYY